MAENTNPYVPEKVKDKYSGDSLKEGSYGFPSDEIPTSEKLTASYARKYAEAIFSQYIGNNTMVSYSAVYDMIINRQYGAGLQSIGKYQKQLLFGANDQFSNTAGNPASSSVNQSAREGQMNINWDVISQIPKLKRIFTGMVENSIFDTTSTAIDEKSGLEREQRMWEMWLDKMAGPALAEIAELAGGMPPEQSYVPEDIEELKAYRDMGGIKLATEIAFEKALKAAFYESDYDREIQVRMAEDLFENNICAVRDEVDPYTQKVKARYVDPTRYIGQYTRRSGYNDTVFAGELIEVSIKEVAAKTHLTEDQIAAVSNTYNNWNGNVTWNTAANPLYTDLASAPYNMNLNFNLQQFKVSVMDVEWISKDINTKVKKKDRNGIERYLDDNKGDLRIEKFQVFKAKWVVGTDIVYDYGYAYDIPYDKVSKRPQLSYHVVRVPGRSMVQMMIPLADMYCLNWYKFQNALVKAPPSGLAVEFQSLQNVYMGGNKLSVPDVIKLRANTGYWLYKSTNPFGKVNTGSRPFEAVEGGIGRQFDEFVRCFDLFEGLAQKITGFTDVAAAQNVGDRSAVRNNEMAYSATANALKPFFNCLVLAKERLSRNIIKRVQIIAKYNKTGYEAYIPATGQASMEAIKITSEYSSVDMGIHVEVNNTQQDAQDITQAAIQSLSPGKDGGQGITMSQFLFIKQMINSNNLKLARVWLGYLEQRNRKEAAESAQKNIQMQNQGNQESLMVAAAEAEKKAVKDHEREIQKLFYEYLFKHDAAAQGSENEIIQKYADAILGQMAQSQQASAQQEIDSQEPSPDSIAMGESMMPENGVLA